jgi:cytochrome P450
MYKLLTEPDNFNFTLEDMASKVMCTLAWDDPTVSEYNIKSAWGLLTQMSPAGPITNVITPLWKLPYCINPWKRAEVKRHNEQQRFWMDRLVQTRRKVELGIQRTCWTEKYLHSEKGKRFSGDYEASSCIGMLALVGVFTIGGPLNYFLIAMIFHPSWQKLCQKEIDSVCGDKMPTLDDSPNLPIMRACIKETMRWKPNVPTGKYSQHSSNLIIFSSNY